MDELNLVYTGIYGSVVALDKRSGRRVWETKLKGCAFVTLLVDGDRVLAGTHGEIFCLAAATGRILWQDGLKGFGLGLMSIATAKASTDTAAVATIAAEHGRQQQTAAAAANAGGTT